MKTKISLGKVDYLNNGKKSCEVVVKMELSDDNCFTASASVYNHLGSNIYSGGQCLDRIAETVERDTPYGAEYREILRLWESYHLNDMHAGTPEQEKALDDTGLTGYATNYEKCCEYLKSIGMYEVTLPNGEPYKFGTGWLKEEIPKEDLDEIRDIIENGLSAVEKYVDKERDEVEEDMER